jgi:hypothetical protein
VVNETWSGKAINKAGPVVGEPLSCVLWTVSWVYFSRPFGKVREKREKSPRKPRMVWSSEVNDGTPNRCGIG